MAMLSVTPAIPHEVTINPAHNTSEFDHDDIPLECRLYQRSLDDAPVMHDERDDHDEHERLHRLYIQSVRAMESA